MDSVPYEYYNYKHSDQVPDYRFKEDIENLKFLEDKFLEVFKGVMKIAEKCPDHIKDDLESLVCLSNPWDLDGDQIANIDNIRLVETDKDDSEEPPSVKEHFSHE